ncbi:MAG: hypothetical protein ACOCP4_00725 [Candidatus Woesearchaeota archaeon]
MSVKLKSLTNINSIPKWNKVICDPKFKHQLICDFCRSNNLKEIDYNSIKCKNCNNYTYIINMEI